MKSKELMQIFELSAKIMSFYKNKDIVYALNDILDMCKSKDEHNESEQIESIKLDKVINYKIESDLAFKNIDSMSVEEISATLNDKNLFPNVDSLKKFAISIGLRGQSRINRDSLIHSIIKFVELSRIDREISSRSNQL